MYNQEASDTYALAYAESLRSLDQQQTALADLRSRALQAMGFAIAAGGALGAIIAAGSDHDGGTFWGLLTVGVVGTIAAIATGIVILLPHGFQFSDPAGSILLNYGDVSPSFALFALTYHHDVDRYRNELKLRRLHRRFIVVLIGVATEVGAWSVLAGYSR